MAWGMSKLLLIKFENVELANHSSQVPSLITGMDLLLTTRIGIACIQQKCIIFYGNPKVEERIFYRCEIQFSVLHSYEATEWSFHSSNRYPKCLHRTLTEYNYYFAVAGEITCSGWTTTVINYTGVG